MHPFILHKQACTTLAAAEKEELISDGSAVELWWKGR